MSALWVIETLGVVLIFSSVMNLGGFGTDLI